MRRMKRDGQSRVVASLSVLTLVLAASCSSTNSQDEMDAGPAPDETAKCAPMPKSKLFPIIGAFFGPDPGPCTMTSSGESYAFHYNSDSELTSEVSTDRNDRTDFSYSEGVLVSATRTEQSGVSMTTYYYAGDAIETVTSEQDAATGYVYQLDERGYVRSARLLNTVTSPSTPTHYSYEYQDCVIEWRVAYDPDDVVNLDATLQYFYDDRGHLTKRSSNISEDEFDYSCW